jgi:hypothetical protein
MPELELPYVSAHADNFMGAVIFGWLLPYDYNENQERIIDVYGAIHEIRAGSARNVNTGAKEIST